MWTFADGYAHRVSKFEGRRAVVLGTGGLSREMAQLLTQIDDVPNFMGFVAERGCSEGEGHYPATIGDDDWLVAQAGTAQSPLVVLGAGFPTARRRMWDMAAGAGLEVLGLVHPTAVVDPDRVELGAGAVICAGVVITCEVSIGDGAIVNWNATIGHDARIGRFTVVNPGANISGNVDVGDGVLVGAGAVILQGLKIGDGATIGAGAVVTKDVVAGQTVVGVPARVVESL